LSFSFDTTHFRRAIFLALGLGLVAVLVAGLGTNGERASAATTPLTPNIVFIQTDDQTVCSVLDLELCPKKSKQVMPRTVELLANQGTTFKTYFATHPRCCPSRASQLTGMYSHNHGILSPTAMATAGSSSTTGRFPSGSRTPATALRT
jgi:arylsulfatase A-like enzyme